MAAPRIYLKIRGGKQRGAYAGVGYIFRTSNTSVVSGDPTISAGSGVPDGAEPNGSLYLRTTGIIYKRASDAWVAMAGTGGATSAAGTGATGTGTASLSSTTATNTAISFSTAISIGKPAAPEVTAVACTLVADATVANAAPMTIAAQPAWPCKLSVCITDADSSISAGLITVVGIDASGRAATETVSLTGGTAVKVTANAYATITSVTPSGLVGNTGSDKVALGHSNKLGLPLPLGFTGFSAYWMQVDGVKEAVAAQDSVAGTITPTSAPNGTRSYEVLCKFDVPVIQVAHTHTDSGHTHTGPSHSHTLS